MAKHPTRIVFLGTPEFAVPCLEAVIASPAFTLIGVVTRPDRPAGRGQQMVKSPVKMAAQRHQIPVFQPESLRDAAAVETVRSWSPEVLVVVAFGQILRQPILDLARYGCLNVHASLLPRWRGAAPIQYAIRAGDSQTGVTIMRTEAGLDTGPILAQRSMPIAPDETSGTLHSKLAVLGAEMLPDVLARSLDGQIAPQPQPETGITHAPTLKKSDGQIDWAQPAPVVDRLVRAYTPWPGTFSYLKGVLLKIIKGRPMGDAQGREPIGMLSLREGYPAVQTGQGLYVLLEVQPAGRQKMDGADFARGHLDLSGAVISSPPQT
jgi:methionyl-tRNA formyltransferase